jgi:hypothetical protein
LLKLSAIDSCYGCGGETPPLQPAGRRRYGEIAALT